MPSASPQPLSHRMVKPLAPRPSLQDGGSGVSWSLKAFGAGEFRQTVRQRLPPIRRHPRQHLTQSRPAAPPHPLRQTPPRLRRNQHNLPPARRRPIPRQQPRRLHPVTQPARRRRRRTQRPRQPAQIQTPRTPDNQQRPHLRRRNRRPQLLHRPLTRLQQHRQPRLRGTHIHLTIGSRPGHLTSHQAPSLRRPGCRGPSPTALSMLPSLRRDSVMISRCPISPIPNVVLQPGRNEPTVAPSLEPPRRGSPRASRGPGVRGSARPTGHVDPAVPAR
jgi:hypothetical protein